MLIEMLAFVFAASFALIAVLGHVVLFRDMLFARNG